MPLRKRGSLAQLVEQLTLNQRVEGSSPSRSTNLHCGHKLPMSAALGGTCPKQRHRLSAHQPLRDIAEGWPESVVPGREPQGRSALRGDPRIGDNRGMRLGKLEVDGRALNLLCEQWGVQKLEAFGSVLREEFGDESDVDLLVTFLPGRKPKLFGVTQP